MQKITIHPISKLTGKINVPGDKSISHRAIMLAALSDGESIIDNFLASADCLATAECFRQMGVELTADGTRLTITGKGLKGLYKPNKSLDVGNSGTTIRLLSGILAGQNFESTVTGDSSIQKRPMKRIAEPLEMMGTKVLGTGGQGEIYPPLTISGGKLKGITYKMPIASAQVKSCLLLAGLYAEGETTIVEPYPSRDHTERMLAYFGVPVKKFKNEVSISVPNAFEGREISVPGDISSAAYFLVAGALLPGSDIEIRGIGTNPTRTGILEVLHRMGVDIVVKDEEIISGEPRANMVISHKSKVKSLEIGGELIPRLIDEIPIIAVLATQAEGATVIKDAKELRVKESDRIRTISTELSKMGAKIEEKEDGMIIYGPTKLKAAKIDSHGDHRIAMSAAIAGLIAEGQTVIEDTECIETSFPGFYNLILSLSR